MTKKQGLFCEEYLVDLNATQAAIRAGYSPASAADSGSANLQNPAVKSCIDKKMAERSKRTGVNADRVILELAKLAFVNPVDVVNVNNATLKADADSDDTAAISAVKVKVVDGDTEMTEREIKFHDKLKALDLLGRHLGLFADKLKVEGAIPIVITGGDELED